MKPVRTRLALMISLIGLGWSASGSARVGPEEVRLPAPDTPFGVAKWPEFWSVDLPEYRRPANGDLAFTAAAGPGLREHDRPRLWDAAPSVAASGSGARHFGCLGAATGMHVRDVDGCAVSADVLDHRFARGDNDAADGTQAASLAVEAQGSVQALALESLRQLLDQGDRASTAGNDAAAVASTPARIATVEPVFPPGLAANDECPFSLPENVAPAAQAEATPAVASRRGIGGATALESKRQAVEAATLARRDAVELVAAIERWVARAALERAERAKSVAAVEPGKVAPSLAFATVGEPLLAADDTCPFSLPDSLPAGQAVAPVADASAPTSAKAVERAAKIVAPASTPAAGAKKRSRATEVVQDSRRVVGKSQGGVQRAERPKSAAAAVATAKSKRAELRPAPADGFGSALALGDECPFSLDEAGTRSVVAASSAPAAALTEGPVKRRKAVDVSGLVQRDAVAARTAVENWAASARQSRPSRFTEVDILLVDEVDIRIDTAAVTPQVEAPVPGRKVRRRQSVDAASLVKRDAVAGSAIVQHWATGAERDRPAPIAAVEIRGDAAPAVAASASTPAAASAETKVRRRQSVATVDVAGRDAKAARAEVERWAAKAGRTGQSKAAAVAPVEVYGALAAEGSPAPRGGDAVAEVRHRRVESIAARTLIKRSAADGAASVERWAEGRQERLRRGREAEAVEVYGALAADEPHVESGETPVARRILRKPVDAPLAAARGDDMMAAVRQWAAQAAHQRRQRLGDAPSGDDAGRARFFAGRHASVASADLDQVRGGFDNGSGLRLSFGIERAVYINGSLVATQNVHVAGAAAGAGQPIPVTVDASSAGVALVQNGPGNVVQVGPMPAAVGTVIQNTLNNQNIRNVTVINATVNSMELSKGMNLHSTLRNVVTDALRR